MTLVHLLWTSETHRSSMSPVLSLNLQRIRSPMPCTSTSSKRHAFKHARQVYSNSLSKQFNTRSDTSNLPLSLHTTHLRTPPRIWSLHHLPSNSPMSCRGSRSPQQTHQSRRNITSMTSLTTMSPRMTDALQLLQFSSKFLVLLNDPLKQPTNVLSTESTSKSFPQRRRCWSPRLAWLNHLVQVRQWTRSHRSYHGFFFSPFTPEWVPHFLGFLIARWWSLHLVTHSLSTCQCHRSSSTQQVVHLGLITLVERERSLWRISEKNHQDLLNLTPRCPLFFLIQRRLQPSIWLRCTFSSSTCFSAWFLL